MDGYKLIRVKDKASRYVFEECWDEVETFD